MVSPSVYPPGKGYDFSGVRLTRVAAGHVSIHLVVFPVLGFCFEVATVCVKPGCGLSLTNYLLVGLVALEWDLSLIDSQIRFGF